MQNLEDELAEKLALYNDLLQKNAALRLRADALERTVAGRDEHLSILNALEALTLGIAPQLPAAPSAAAAGDSGPAELAAASGGAEGLRQQLSAEYQHRGAPPPPPPQSAFALPSGPYNSPSFSSGAAAAATPSAAEAAAAGGLAGAGSAQLSRQGSMVGSGTGSGSGSGSFRHPSIVPSRAYSADISMLPPSGTGVTSFISRQPPSMSRSYSCDPRIPLQGSNVPPIGGPVSSGFVSPFSTGGLDIPPPAASLAPVVTSALGVTSVTPLVTGVSSVPTGDDMGLVRAGSTPAGGSSLAAAAATGPSRAGSLSHTITTEGPHPQGGTPAGSPSQPGSPWDVLPGAATGAAVPSLAPAAAAVVGVVAGGMAPRARSLGHGSRLQRSSSTNSGSFSDTGAPVLSVGPPAAAAAAAAAAAPAAEGYYQQHPRQQPQQQQHEQYHQQQQQQGQEVAAMWPPPAAAAPASSRPYQPIPISAAALTLPHAAVITTSPFTLPEDALIPSSVGYSEPGLGVGFRGPRGPPRSSDPGRYGLGQQQQQQPGGRFMGRTHQRHYSYSEGQGGQGYHPYNNPMLAPGILQQQQQQQRQQWQRQQSREWDMQQQGLGEMEWEQQQQQGHAGMGGEGRGQQVQPGSWQQQQQEELQWRQQQQQQQELQWKQQQQQQQQQQELQWRQQQQQQQQEQQQWGQGHGSFSGQAPWDAAEAAAGASITNMPDQQLQYGQSVGGGNGGAGGGAGYGGVKIADFAATGARRGTGVGHFPVEDVRRDQELYWQQQQQQELVGGYSQAIQPPNAAATAAAAGIGRERHPSAGFGSKVEVPYEQGLPYVPSSQSQPGDPNLQQQQQQPLLSRDISRERSRRSGELLPVLQGFPLQQQQQQQQPGVLGGAPLLLPPGRLRFGQPPQQQQQQQVQYLRGSSSSGGVDVGGLLRTGAVQEGALGSDLRVGRGLEAAHQPTFQQREQQQQGQKQELSGWQVVAASMMDKLAGEDPEAAAHMQQDLSAMATTMGGGWETLGLGQTAAAPYDVAALAGAESMEVLLDAAPSLLGPAPRGFDAPKPPEAGDDLLQASRRLEEEHRVAAAAAAATAAAVNAAVAAASSGAGGGVGGTGAAGGADASERAALQAISEAASAAVAGPTPAPALQAAAGAGELVYLHQVVPWFRDQLQLMNNLMPAVERAGGVGVGGGVAMSVGRDVAAGLQLVALVDEVILRFRKFSALNR